MAPNSLIVVSLGPRNPRREASLEEDVEASALRAACTVSQRGISTKSQNP
jgi:hypothetical protein